MNKRWADVFMERVQSPHGFWLIAGIALVLALPSLSFGFLSDDHVAYSIASTDVVKPLKSFGFEPSPGLDRSSGYLAWWSSPELSVKFLRPLSAMSHADIFLGPRAAWLMHANNVLLYIVLVFVAFQLYRELLPTLPRVAALASLLFAIDEGHGPAVGWISSRNTLLYSSFALAALLMHHRNKRIASAVFTALALLSGEGGIALVAYLIAYEVAFEHAGLRPRGARLWPQLAVIALWLVAYVTGGYGVHGSSFYREISQPFSTLLAGLVDLPFWLFGLLGPSVISSASLVPGATARVVAALLCAAVLVAFSALSRTREERFFALAALLCLPPLFTTIPQDRVLMPASFAASGLLASFITRAATSARAYVRGVRWMLIAVHVVLAPLLFVPMLGQARAIERGSQAIASVIPAQSPAQVILVNTPIELVTLYSYNILREQPLRTPPELLQQLYAGTSPLVVKRVDERTLEVQAEHGWGATIFERIFGQLENMPRPGESVQLDRLTVTVGESDAEGHPMRVQFRFPSALEAPERQFYVWQGNAPTPWLPPAVGQQIALAPLNLMSALGR